MKAFDIRPATGKDISFIYDTWLKSFRCDSPLGRSSKKSVYFDEYKLVIDFILSQSETIVAHSTTDTNLILAYLVFAPGTIHYAFCKEAFRKLGITKALFLEAFSEGQEPIQVTHRTGESSEIFRNHQFLIHNPFKLFKQGAA